MSKWMRNENELDDFQQQVATSEMSTNMVVTGCAGSGKSIIALHKAKQLEAAGKSYLVIVFTKALWQFMEGGIRELDLQPNRVTWEANWAKEMESEGAEYILVDEAQDFSIDKIKKFKKSASEAVSFFGDSQQQIFKNGSSMNDIIGLSNNFKPENLQWNYRMPKKVARVANYILAQESNYVNRCKREGDQTPMVLKRSSEDDELKFILNSIKGKSLEDVGVLVPNNELVHLVSNYLEQNGLRVEKRMRYRGDDILTLDFNSTNPKVMTYHSSKGLQFNDVFLPFAESDILNAREDNFYQKPLYVAFTRTLNNVYVTYSNELTDYLKDVPKNLIGLENTGVGF